MEERGIDGCGRTALDCSGEGEDDYLLEGDHPRILTSGREETRWVPLFTLSQSSTTK